MTLRAEVVSPERILYSGEADMVVARTVAGEIAFLTDHAPFLGALDIGQVKVVKPDGEDRFAVHGGFVEVSDNKVTVLSDVAEPADQIDVSRARRALEQADRLEDEEEAAAARRRAEVRLEVAAGGPTH